MDSDHDYADGGFKLVTDEYAPLFYSYDNGQRYKIGTTQWISAAAKPKHMTLCTPSALHYCECAIDTTAFADEDRLASLRLLRVTPVRWCPPSQRDANGNPLTKYEKEEDDDDDDSPLPLFVTASRLDSNAKRGAHGLRVDGEVTGAERDAALSGVRTTRCGTLMKSVSVMEKGVSVAYRFTDVLDNVFSDVCVGQPARHGVYTLGCSIFHSTPTMILSSEWKAAAATTELLFAMESPYYPVLKRYTKAEFLAALASVGVFLN